jgi:hypothetical protein
VKRRTDLVTLAAGLVLAFVSGFFLLADDPGADDIGTGLVPLVLLVAGATMLLGSLARRSS